LNLSRSLLAEAGYAHGFNLTLDCAQESPVMIELSEAIAAQLSQIISVHLNIIPWEKCLEFINARNRSIYLVGWLPATGDGGEIFDYLLRSDQDPLGIGSYNYGFYSNQTVDQIGREIAHTLNQKDRSRLMQEGFQVAMDDVACIPLYISVCMTAMADDIVWSPRADQNLLVEEITVK
jgi:peptide/nickel transport system substrate-binding protein